MPDTLRGARLDGTAHADDHAAPGAATNAWGKALDRLGRLAAAQARPDTPHADPAPSTPEPEPQTAPDANGTAAAPPPDPLADPPPADLAAVVRELRAIRQLLADDAAELLDAAAAARLLGIGQATLYRLRGAGRLPAPVRIGGSAALTRWRRSDLLAYLAGLKPAK